MFVCFCNIQSEIFATKYLFILNSLNYAQIICQNPGSLMPQAVKKLTIKHNYIASYHKVKNFGSKNFGK